MDPEEQQSLEEEITAVACPSEGRTCISVAGIHGQIELRSEDQEQAGAHRHRLKLLEGQKCQ